MHILRQRTQFRDKKAMKRIFSFFFGAVALGCLLLHPDTSCAMRCFIVSPEKTYFGTAHWVKANEGETLLDIARDFDLGYNQILAANPDNDPWVPSKKSLVLVPLAFVLPQERISSGIVVNLAEMRLYFFLSNGGHDYFLTAPIGVGTEGFLTRLGVYNVKSKTVNPTWVVPESIKNAEPDLPDKVLPGPDNPLGDFALRLSQFEYAIHGTNKPWGVGRRVSHGCIRMYPEDIAELYAMVPVGSIVHVIYEPIKIGWGDGKCWIQVFDDFDNRIDNPLSKVRGELSFYETAIGPLDVDLTALFKALKEKTGVPVAVASPKKP
jgi:L,D-transpeptidase ErfK/SrfK